LLAVTVFGVGERAGGDAYLGSAPSGQAESEGVAVVAGMAQPDGAELIEGFGQPGGAAGDAAAGRGTEGDEAGFDVVVASFDGPDFLGGSGGEDVPVG
jgi:hypothetical protein